MKPEELILAILQRFPGLDDDALAKLSGIEPRQKVSQACRDLESQGHLVRERQEHGRIVNMLTKQQ